MNFSECPECGESNHFERSGDRSFDCGFKGDSLGTRLERCDANGQKSGRRGQPATEAVAQPGFNDEAARYRLALLDAAQVIDLLAADMSKAGQGAYVERCRELARQLREVGGHGASGTSFNGSRANRKGSGLTTIVRHARIW